MKRLFLIALLSALASCESVRTVYDANGKEVNPDEPGGEKDLMAHFEKGFQDSFSEEKGPDGVPITKSNRVSQFQKQIDDANRDNKQFNTASYLSDKTSSLRDMNFGGAKSFAGADRSEKDMRTAFSTDMRPDFMNESHGISADRRFRSTADDRSPYESGVLDSRDRSFATRSSRYDGAAPNGYVETRRNKTPEPEITDFQDYYRKSIHSTKQLLNREN